jgi:hypothetical protein
MRKRPILAAALCAAVLGAAGLAGTAAADAAYHTERLELSGLAARPAAGWW